MSEPPVEDWPSQLAHRYREAFESERQKRLRVLADLIGTRTREHVVLVMMTNSGYMDLFANWVRSCDANGIEVRSWSVLFAVDDDAAKGARDLGFQTYHDRVSYGDQPEGAVRRFGDGNFRRLMFQKTAIVHDVLELGYDVLFQDVDVVWRKDPLDYLLDARCGPCDARFMYDGPNPRHAPLHANTGFFLLRHTPASRRLWSDVLDEYEEMVRGGGQQQIVNRLLAREGLQVDILPEEDFANGHLYDTKKPKPDQEPVDPYVVHCSWTHDLQHKLRKYKQLNLWYLDGSAERTLATTSSRDDAPLAAAAVNDMQITRVGDRPFFLFLDIFVHWSGRKITAVAPYYGDDIDWSEHGVDLENVVLTFGSEQVRGRFIPHRLDSYEPCVLFDFEDPALEAALCECSSLSFVVTAGPHRKRFELSTALPPAFDAAMSVIVRDENRWIRFYLDYYLSCMGVDHVFVYDNNTVDRAGLAAVLRPYVEKGSVTFLPWSYHWRNRKDRKQIGQPPQQAHSLNRYGNTRWIGFFDVDEFLRIPGRSLPEFLRDYDAGAIGGVSFDMRWFFHKGSLRFEDDHNPLLTYFDSKPSARPRRRQKLFVSPANVRFLRLHWLEEGKSEIAVEDADVFFHHYALRKERFERGKEEPNTTRDEYMLVFAERFGSRPQSSLALRAEAARPAALETTEQWIAHLVRSFERAEACQSGLSEEALSVAGMCGRYTRHFLNNLCAFDGCRYLEIGSHKGASLCSAMSGNSISAVAIDNWSLFGDARGEFLDNVGRHRGECDLRVIEQDCFTVDPNDLGKINVFFYDGGHTERSHYEALERYSQCLETRAIVVVDDWNWERVRSGTRRAIRELDLPIAFEREIVLPPQDVMQMPRHPGRRSWWNGIYALVVDKERTPARIVVSEARSEKLGRDDLPESDVLAVVAFSKDRACQLEAMLRSQKRYLKIPHANYVIYSATTQELQKGYDRVIGWYPEVSWRKQEDFREDVFAVLRHVQRRGHRHLTFLVDDLIFTRECTGEGLIDVLDADPEVLAASMRLGENVRYCHPRDIETAPPDFANGYKWSWRKARSGYWNYPMSQDGHIFRSADVIDYIATFKFHNPNTLEARTAGRPIDKPYLVCNREPALVNLPLNRVQKTYRNRCADFSVEALNAKFLEGLVLDIRHLVGHTYTSCHVEPDVRFIDPGAIDSCGAVGVDTGRRSVDLRDLRILVIDARGDEERKRSIHREFGRKGLRWESVGDVPCDPEFLGLAVAHLRVLRRDDLRVPFAILEDNIEFTAEFRYDFDVPEEADALYLGASRFGITDLGKPSWGRWNNTQYARYDSHFLRVFNMLGTHAIVYLSEDYRRAAAQAIVGALTNYAHPFPADVGFAAIQPSFVVLTPNDPVCRQSKRWGGSEEATCVSLTARVA